MKKISVVLALTLVLVAAFATVALADVTHNGYGFDPVTNTQTLYDGSTTGATVNAYSSNTVSSSTTTNATAIGTQTTNIYLPGDPSAVQGATPSQGQGAIHSNYTQNTDACAACHSAHNGNGDSLLQWDTYGPAGLSQACMACHDGTVTATYDVVQGHIGSTGKDSAGGLFAVEKDGAGNNSASQHGVFSGIQISAAFGGGSAQDSNGNWTAQFDCGSCHAPHGAAANYRILDPNPNFVQTQGWALNDPTLPSATKTTLFKTTTVTAANVTSNDTWSITAATSQDTSAWNLKKGLGDIPITGYPYTVTLKAYDSSNTDITATAKPVLAFSNGYVVNGTTGEDAYVTFTNATGVDHVTATYVPAVRVTGTVNNKLTSTETVTYGTGMNQFCGACHTDYNNDNQKLFSNLVNEATTGDAPSADKYGVYGTQHTRHKVGQLWHGPVKGLAFGAKYEVTCLTCHFAHGVDQDRWSDQVTQVGALQGNVANVTPELNGSSRLKRLPNMSVCEACHSKETGNNSTMYDASAGPQ